MLRFLSTNFLFRLSVPTNILNFEQRSVKYWEEEWIGNGLGGKFISRDKLYNWKSKGGKKEESGIWCVSFHSTSALSVREDCSGKDKKGVQSVKYYHMRTWVGSRHPCKSQAWWQRLAIPALWGRRKIEPSPTSEFSANEGPCLRKQGGWRLRNDTESDSWTLQYTCTGMGTSTPPHTHMFIQRERGTKKEKRARKRGR